MSSTGKNHLFTLTIVPDNGYDTKSGNINFRLIVTFFSVLLSVFFICLFFIIGYHIKIIQEKDYVNSFSIMQKHLKNINEKESNFKILTKKISNIKGIDKALRLYAYISVPDDNMYKAGIGGHQIVDRYKFNGLNEDLRTKLYEFTLHLKLLDRQLFVAHNSLHSVGHNLQKQRDEISFTPSQLPTYSLQISSGFGMRRNPITGKRQFHDAVDFAGKKGDKIYATADGTVITVKFHKYRGKYIEIIHKYGYQTLYAHLNDIFVKKGQNVNKGDIIGTMGRSGRTTGVNLHYAVTHNGRKINPTDYF